MNSGEKIDSDATCAGKEITGAMHTYSFDLLRSCGYFAKLVQNTKDPEEIRFLNSACVFSAASTIEAKVNEWISICAIISDTKPPIEFWESLEKAQKNMRLEEKWNLIASVNGGELWDSGNEPFQSYGVIVSLRNELVHYKGQFFGKDEAPNKRIKDLMNTFGLKSSATFVESDTSSWAIDLLGEPKLAKWVADKINEFHVQVYPMLLGKL